MIPKNRRPTSPGEILREEFLTPRKMTQGDLAGRMGIPIQRINLLVNDKRAVTAETAILLAKALGTSPEFWTNLEAQRDLKAEVAQPDPEIHLACRPLRR